MDHNILTKIITLDGSALLAQFQLDSQKSKPLCLDVDLYKNVNTYRESALLYQVRRVLDQPFSPELFTQAFFFVDFLDFFKYKDNQRNALFEKLLCDGFDAYWAGTEEVLHFVPFEKSQSQAKDCVISFIREDLFLPVRKRLDLDIGFRDYTFGKQDFAFRLENTIPQLSKLYAYRGLYLSEAQRLEGVKELLDENRIVILQDEEIRFSLETVQRLGLGAYYTAQDVGETSKGQRILEPMVASDFDKSYHYDPFDGVGLISARGAAILNRALDGKKFAQSGIDPENTTPQKLHHADMAVSFQFRMPFCKGMLHTVDFHKFLAEEMDLQDDLWVTDIFGQPRNLKHADIILNQNLFKLWGLLKKDSGFKARKKDFAQYYFGKLREFEHSIYIVKTDKEQRYTGFGKLTAQIINTLPFTQEAFDRIVSRHTERARQYQLLPILLSQGNLPVLEEDSGEIGHRYIKANPLLALDGYVEDLVDSCRKQALHRLYQGKLDVKGDMRFLCRDLVYYMRRLGLQCQSSRNLELMQRGQVYLPAERGGVTCALFRSPHLCPNENVLAQTYAPNALYETYLGHLTRVVFISAESQMPDALGGADFDGDMVVIAFQQEVVEACQKACYREDGQPSLELIRIPSLKYDSTESGNFPYVNVDAIQNTFNSQIGLISNATMRICAAETAAGQELPYPSKFCAILNGVEIDAAKTGVRPDLSQVSGFTGKLKMESDNPEDDDTQTNDRISRAMQLVKTYLKVSNELKRWDLPGLSVTEKDKKYTVKLGKEELTHFKNESQDVPFVYQLLIKWAESMRQKDEVLTQKKQQAVDELYKKLPNSKKSGSDYPRDEILKQVVFACPKTMSHSQSAAIDQVLSAYKTVKQAVDTVQKHADPSQERILRRNLLYILRYQYDDLDITQNEDITIRQVGNSVSLQLKQTLDTTEILFRVLEDNFYGQDTDPNQWMFRQSPQKDSHLVNALSKLQPQAAQILENKGFHGYDLMYFALRELHASAVAEDRRNTLHTETGDSLLDELYAKAAKAVDQKQSASYVGSKVLPQPCRKQLEILLGETDPNVLIPLVYKRTNDKTRAIFWKLFSWEEIEAYLRKVGSYAQ